MVTVEEVAELFRTEDDRAALASLTERGLAFRIPTSGRIHALSRLVEQLM